MDDDEEEREFSKSIVYDFFTQAESTFQKMDSNLYRTPLPSFRRGASPSHPLCRSLTSPATERRRTSRSSPRSGIS